MAWRFTKVHAIFPLGSRQGKHEAPRAPVVRQRGRQRPEAGRGVTRDVAEVLRHEERQVPGDRRGGGPEERAEERVGGERRRGEAQRVAGLDVHERVEGRVDAAEGQRPAQRRAPREAARRQAVVRVEEGGGAHGGEGRGVGAPQRRLRGRPRDAQAQAPVEGGDEQALRPAAGARRQRALRFVLRVDVDVADVVEPVGVHDVAEREGEAPGGRGGERGPPGGRARRHGDRALRSAHLDEEVGREHDVGRERLGVVVRQRVPRRRGEPPDGVRGPAVRLGLARRVAPPLRDVRAVHAEHGLLGLASKPLEFVHWVLPRHPGGREGVLEEMMRILRYVCPGVGGDWPYP